MHKLKIIVTVAIACMMGSASAAGDSDYVAFALKQAQRAGFNGCNAAIREAFEEASGKDIRIWTDNMQQTKSEQLQIIGVWGSEGDTVTKDVNIRRVGKTCQTHHSTRFVLNKKCREFLSETPTLKVDSVTGDILGGVIGSGVTALLHQGTNNCFVEFRRGTITPAN